LGGILRLGLRRLLRCGRNSQSKREREREPAASSKQTH
jgi:hypothetical protein